MNDGASVKVLEGLGELINDEPNVNFLEDSLSNYIV